MRTPWPLLPTLLIGCGFGLQPSTTDGLAWAYPDTDTDTDTDTDDDDDDDDDLVDPEIDSVDPDRGSTEGGLEVILYGQFNEDASVRVGGVEAELKSVQPVRGELHFYTPEAGEAGTVNVVLDSNDQTAKLTDGFTYYTEGAGLPGMVGSLDWIDIVGTYWAEEPIDYGYAFFVPIIPTEFEWGLLYAAGVDDCVSDDPADSYKYQPSLQFHNLGSGSRASIDAAGKTIDFTWDNTTGQFSNDNVLAGEFAAGATYDLTEFEPSDTDEVPSFTMTDLVRTPASFTVDVPNITGVDVPQVSRTMAIAWSGGAAADGVFITLRLMNPAGNAWQETITCAAQDDGEFNIPSDAFKTSWPSSPRQLDIQISRYKLASGTIPYDSSESAVIGQYTVYGAGYTK